MIVDQKISNKVFRCVKLEQLKVQLQNKLKN